MNFLYLVKYYSITFAYTVVSDNRYSDFFLVPIDKKFKSE